MIDRGREGRVAARRLAAWYARHARSLPWRESPGPYEVLVSEIMLQQTTVETVVPYYRRFLERFPDVRALASAAEEDLLAAWSGLGYYRRARSLHAAARAIVERHGGVVPPDREGLLALPGIGPYTASAILAIAFGRKAVALDGNLRRVLSRLACYEGNPDRPAGTRALEEAGMALLDGADPSLINQALMDLGATICLQRQPRCLLCPVSGGCGALRAGAVDRIPPPRARPGPVGVRLAAAVLRRGGRILMRRRGGDLMPGMYELPMVEVERSSGAPAGAWPRPTPGDGSMRGERVASDPATPGDESGGALAVKTAVAAVARAGGRMAGGGGRGSGGGRAMSRAARPARGPGAGPAAPGSAAIVLGRALTRAGVAPGRLRPAAVVKHTITRHRITIEVFQGDGKRAGAGGSPQGKARGPRATGSSRAEIRHRRENPGGTRGATDLSGERSGRLVWVEMARLGGLALTGAARKILRVVPIAKTAGASGAERAARRAPARPREVRRPGSGRASSARSAPSGRRDRPR